MDISGANQKTLYTSTYATQFNPSPDGKWMAFTELFQLLHNADGSTAMRRTYPQTNKAIPLNQTYARLAGTYLHWSKDSQKLMWTLGPKYFTRDIRNAFPFVDGGTGQNPGYRYGWC